MHRRLNRRPLILAGVLLGVGMVGFVDGILFHQLLQWHGMLTAKFPKSGVELQTAVVNLQVNMFWDGVFHAFTWLMTALGLTLLWRAGSRDDVPWSGSTFVGSLALGGGLFNLLEGVINHHVLHLHHVVETPNHLMWDLGFLGSGLVLMAIGAYLISAGRDDAVPRAATAGDLAV